MVICVDYLCVRVDVGCGVGVDIGDVVIGYGDVGGGDYFVCVDVYLLFVLDY